MICENSLHYNLEYEGNTCDYCNEKLDGRTKEAKKLSMHMQCALDDAYDRLEHNMTAIKWFDNHDEDREEVFEDDNELIEWEKRAEKEYEEEVEKIKKIMSK